MDADEHRHQQAGEPHQPHDPLDDPHRVSTVERLLEVYPGTPAPNSLAKESRTITASHARIIAAAPFVVVATIGDGGLDQSPRGDAPGFVTVEDEHTLLLPERRGNNRIDSLRNIIATRAWRCCS